MKNLVFLAAGIVLLFSVCSGVNAQTVTDNEYMNAYFVIYSDYLAGEGKFSKDELLDVIEYYLTNEDLSGKLNSVGSNSNQMIGTILADAGLGFDCGACESSLIGIRCCIYRIGEVPMAYECVGTEVMGVKSYSWKELWQCTYGCCANKCCLSPEGGTTTTKPGTTTTTNPGTTTTSTTSTTTTSIGDFCQSDKDCILAYGPCWICPVKGGKCSKGDKNCERDDTCTDTYGPNWKCVSPGCCAPVTTTTTTTSTTTTTGGTTTTPGGSTTTSTTSTTTTSIGDFCQSDKDCILAYGPCWICPVRSGNCAKDGKNCDTNKECTDVYGPAWWCSTPTGCCAPVTTTTTTSTSSTTSSSSTTTSSSTTSTGGTTTTTTSSTTTTSKLTCTDIRGGEINVGECSKDVDGLRCVEDNGKASLQPDPSCEVNPQPTTTTTTTPGPTPSPSPSPSPSPGPSPSPSPSPGPSPSPSPSPTPGQCTETDQGYNQATFGTCTDTTGTYSDQCVDTTSLREYYCNPASTGTCTPYPAPCPAGQTCQNGACSSGGAGSTICVNCCVPNTGQTQCKVTCAGVTQDLSQTSQITTCTYNPSTGGLLVGSATGSTYIICQNGQCAGTGTSSCPDTCQKTPPSPGYTKNRCDSNTCQAPYINDPDGDAACVNALGAGYKCCCGPDQQADLCDSECKKAGYSSGFCSNPGWFCSIKEMSNLNSYCGVNSKCCCLTQSGVSCSATTDPTREGKCTDKNGKETLAKCQNGQLVQYECDPNGYCVASTPIACPSGTTCYQPTSGGAYCRSGTISAQCTEVSPLGDKPGSCTDSSGTYEDYCDPNDPNSNYYYHSRCQNNKCINPPTDRLKCPTASDKCEGGMCVKDDLIVQVTATKIDMKTCDKFKFTAVVTDTSGNPVEGATVIFESPDYPGFYWYCTSKTNEEGVCQSDERTMTDKLAAKVTYRVYAVVIQAARHKTPKKSANPVVLTVSPRYLDLKVEFDPDPVQSRCVYKLKVCVTDKDTGKVPDQTLAPGLPTVTVQIEGGTSFQMKIGQDGCGTFDSIGSVCTGQTPFKASLTVTAKLRCYNDAVKTVTHTVEPIALTIQKPTVNPASVKSGESVDIKMCVKNEIDTASKCKYNTYPTETSSTGSELTYTLTCDGEKIDTGDGGKVKTTTESGGISCYTKKIIMKVIQDRTCTVSVSKASKDCHKDGTTAQTATFKVVVPKCNDECGKVDIGMSGTCTDDATCTNKKGTMLAVTTECSSQSKKCCCTTS